MKAVKTVRELITEDNSSLTFFSELEKSITKEASGQKKTIAYQENETVQKKKTQNGEIQSTLCKKNENTKIPFKKVTLSISGDGKYHETERYCVGKIGCCFE